MPEIFAPEINWLTSLVEEHEYETTVFRAFDDTEQRQSLMNVPHRRLSYSISALEGREAQFLEGLIRRVQADPCYVPYWRGAKYLDLAITSSTNTIMVDTVGTGFEINNWVMLYLDPHTTLVREITGIYTDHLTVTPNVSGVWPRRTKVVPAFLGQLAPSVDLDYASKEAKIVLVTFDLHPVKNQISGDCNWALSDPYPESFPPETTFVIDPTGGPTGGPAMKLTIPPNSRIGGSILFPGVFVRVIGLPPGLHVTMEAKIKTSWDIGAASINDGVPGIALAINTPPDTVGTGFESATTAAFEAWEPVFVDGGSIDSRGQMFPILAFTDGTLEDIAWYAWFAEIIIRDGEGNIIFQCLPAPEFIPPTETPIFTPLTALHRPGQSLQQVHRTVRQLASPAGVFSVRSSAPDPLTDHALNLIFFNSEEWYAFQAFFDLVMGAFGTFWIPSYQQDLTPIGLIGATDVDILIEDVGYAAGDFLSTSRRQIAFVQPNGSFVKRSITAAVSNGNGTETITINEPLGFTFQQTNGNGICFLWYGRFSDDVAKTEWLDTDQATIEIAMTELRDPPDGGSGDSADGFIVDVAP